MVNDQIQFEKERLEYCIKAYERELDRKKSIENKAKLYLSIITLFVGAVFLKISLFQSN